MKTMKGDLLQFAEDGIFDVIIHGCNCFNTMGGGLAKTIKDKYPLAYEVDSKTTRGDKSKIGTYSTADIGSFKIINAYTQYNLRSLAEDVFEYEHFQRILDQLSSDFPETTRFGFPLIGCGLAGGNRDKIVSMIEQFSENRDVTLVEFE